MSRSHRGNVRKPRGCLRWAQRLVATLLILHAASLAPAQTEVMSAPAERVAHLQSLQQVAQEAFVHRNAPSERLREVRALRASLVKLGESLAELDADPTPDHAVALLAGRQAAQSRFAAFRGAGAPPARSALSGHIETEMDALWVDVDAAAVDPIGQQSRIELARQRVEAALEEPRIERGPSMQGALSPPEAITR